MRYVAFCRPGSDRLSRVLRRSTIGAGAFHGRVRNGNGCRCPAMTTRSAKRNIEKLAAGRCPAFLKLCEHVWRPTGQPRSGCRVVRKSFAFALSGQVLRTCPEMSMSNENDQANRAISTGKLHALLHVHTRPINVVVFHGSDREHSFSGWFPA